MDVALGAATQAAATGSEMGIKVLKEAQQMGVKELELIESLPAQSANQEGQGGNLDVSA